MVDITSPLFQLPEGVNDTLYAVVQPSVVSDIATGTVGGTGAFDQLMASVKAHLELEFQNGRITGAEYTKAYVQMAQTAMQTALQFVMGNSNSYWQAQNAQVQAIAGRVALEAARYNYQNTLPAQLVLLTEQADVQRAQTANTRLDGTAVTGVMGAQKSLYGQQVTSYQRDAEVKAAKIFSDSWITQKTIDNGLTAPTALTNDSVNEVLAAIMSSNWPGMGPVA